MKHFVLEAAADTVDLVTVKNVPIMATGTFKLARGGEQTFTLEDLQAAANAPVADPACKLPRMGVGHESDLGDGEPSFGTYENMRVVATAGGKTHTLYADVAGVPRWLAKIMPSAFPSRSIEGDRNYVSASGMTHKLYVSAVKLLGVVLPGISTLSDLRHTYGTEMPEGTTILASFEDPDSKVIVVNTNTTNHVPKEEVRQVDPKALREQLGMNEAATDAEVNARLAELKVAGDKVAADKVAADALKAQEDAAAAEAAATAEAARQAAANLPEGMVAIDKEALAELQVAASRANALHASAQQAEADSEIDGAIKAGKFPKARRDHYATLYKADPEGTKTLFASMAAGLLPVEELGNSGDNLDGATDEIYPETMLSPAQRTRVAAAREGKVLALVPGDIMSDKVG